MNDFPPQRPPEYELAMQLMRVVESYLAEGGSPLTAMVALLRAQESLVFMMSKVLEEAKYE